MKLLYTLVGMKHHQGAEALVASLPNGEPVKLVREPDNQYDSRAVQVHVREQLVGYIASRENRELADQMDAAARGLAHTFEAKFVAGQWPSIEVDVASAKP